MEEQKQNSPSDESQAVRPTRRQRELLAFIDAFIAEHGYSPSYREIMTGVGYSSVATVSLHVNNLIARGHLIKRGRSARSIEVVASEIAQPSQLATNQVAPAEEKWLVQKVDYLCSQLEATAGHTMQDVEQLAVVLRALRVLGLDEAAQSFHERLTKLQETAV